MRSHAHAAVGSCISPGEGYETLRAILWPYASTVLSRGHKSGCLGCNKTRKQLLGLTSCVKLCHAMQITQIFIKVLVEHAGSHFVIIILEPYHLSEVIAHTLAE